jgi:hypothetical protein
MPDAATNPCPDLPALPPAADLETRVVLKHGPRPTAALAELRLAARRLGAPELAAVWSSERIRAIRALLNAAADQVRLGAPKHFSPELVELVVLAPDCRSGDLLARGSGEPQRAACVLKQLVRFGIWQAEGCWRDKIFVNRRYFADRGYLDLLASDAPGSGPHLHLAARGASGPQAKAHAA